MTQFSPLAAALVVAVELRVATAVAAEEVSPEGVGSGGPLGKATGQSAGGGSANAAPGTGQTQAEATRGGAFGILFREISLRAVGRCDDDGEQTEDTRERAIEHLKERYSIYSSCDYWAAVSTQGMCERDKGSCHSPDGDESEGKYHHLSRKPALHRRAGPGLLVELEL